MSEEALLTEIKRIGDFEIAPFDGNVDSSYQKLDVNSSEKMHLSALMAQMPALMMSNAASNMYYLSFPDGIQHTLMSLHQGGQASTWINSNGKIGGTASLYNASASAVFLGVFTAMSIATSQYFLTQINNELNMLNMKIDKILAFLYGDKKAELLSEMRFVSYSYKNYSSIMHHEQQRLATLIGLQESRKVAMKDIEFYIRDLNGSVNAEFKSDEETEGLVGNCIQLRDSLELSLQLYTMCSVLEVHYALNNDKEYIKNIEEDLISYNDKCRDRILDCFGTLKGRISNYNPAFLFGGNIDKPKFEAKVGSLIEEMHSNEASVDRNKISNMLKLTNIQTKYVVDTVGNVYCKKD